MIFYLLGQIWPILQEPCETLLESRQLLYDLVFQYQAGIERDEPHHRANTHSHALILQPKGGGGGGGEGGRGGEKGVRVGGGGGK